MTTATEPRLASVRLDRFRPTSERRTRWQDARPGMTLDEVREATGALMGEVRWLVNSGAIAFDPPIGPLRSGARPGPRSSRPREPGAPLQPPGDRERACLGCGVPFRSAGSWNRLCDACRERAGHASPFEPEW